MDEIRGSVFRNEGNEDNSITKERGKRLKDQSTWKRVVNSAKRYSEKASENRSEKKHLKKFSKYVDCGYPRKRFDSVNLEERGKIFESFYFCITFYRKTFAVY